MGEASTQPLDNIGIAGWFARENRETLHGLIRQHNVRSVVEIGSFLGLSAVWFAQRVEQVTCIDTWREDAEEETQNNLLLTLRRWDLPRDFFGLFRDNVMRSGHWHKILPIRGDSAAMLPQVADADLVYIDGDHSYEGCKRDITLYGPHARKIICGDDYTDREGFGVIQAVSECLPGAQHIGPFWWAVQ